MSDHRLHPRGIKPGSEADVFQTVDGIAVWGPPVPLTPLVCIDENGNPGLVFDDDGQIVHTED